MKISTIQIFGYSNLQKNFFIKLCCLFVLPLDFIGQPLRFHHLNERATGDY